uniref:Reverse transcriptase RNase H-like domain-containing protein n=1 Tax=Cajanus cajan TaxID=3821 RepID=A0A151RAQ7_CAJCA|nr:hypothetical protein KK1_039047 [Cajanus cajan]
MIVYISVSDKAISTVLVQEKTEQIPVYFISRVLQEAETRYQHLEKTVLALVHTARRLRHYFQSHKVVVRTDCPIVKVLRKPELAGRMVSWSVEFFKTSNNQAEYEALLAGLRLASDLGVGRIKCWSDSQVHPQSNGQAEAANKVVLKELKRRLGQAKGTWPDFLPEILWAYRCTPQTSTRETPFRLTYGTDAMILVEVGEPSLRRTQFDEEANGQALNIELDLVDEARDLALINMEACRTRISRKYRTKVKPRGFQPGDLVWRVTGEARKDKT